MATETEFRTTLEHTIEKYRQVLERFPYESSAQLALAELTQLRGLRLEALLSHQEILKSSPVPESRVALADVYASQGLYNQAFEELSATLAQYPIFPEAHYCAAEFAETVPLPDELKQALERPCHQPDLARAFLQVGLKRSVVMRELQELSQASERSKGDPLALYRVEETRKRLLLLERRLVRIEQLEAQRVVREAEAERLRVLEQERLRQLQELQQATPVELTNESNGTSSGWEDVVSEPRTAPVPVAEEAVAEESASTEEESPNELVFETPAEVEESTDLVIEYEIPTQEEASHSVESFESSSEVDALPDLVPTLEAELPPHLESGLGDDLVDNGLEVDPSFQEPPAATWSEPELAVADTFEDVVHQDVEEDGGLSIDLHFAEPEELSIDEQMETVRNTESEETRPVAHTEVSEPVPVPPVVPEAIQVPIEPTPVSPAPVEPAPAQAPSPGDRSARYAKIQSEISGLIAILAKTRGVTSIHVVARDGYLVDQSSRDAMPAERVSEFIVEGLAILEGFAAEPKYWVLECSGGIVVFQIIDARHVLLAVGQAGANFGALRYTMDKMRPQFGQFLGGVDE